MRKSIKFYLNKHVISVLFCVEFWTTLLSLQNCCATTHTEVARQRKH